MGFRGLGFREVVALWKRQSNGYRSRSRVSGKGKAAHEDLESQPRIFKSGGVERSVNIAAAAGYYNGLSGGRFGG